MKDSVAGKLREIVGAGHALTGAGVSGRYLTDAAGRVRDGAVAPCAVVMPADAGEVVRVVVLAAEEGLGVAVRGGGTGLWGDGLRGAGARTILVSTERMAGGPDIHRDDLYAVVGAGVVAERLRRGAEAAGLLYPVDVASEAGATVGGCIAEAAVGMRGLKYGATRNYVLGLELVTPEGKILRVGGKTVKNVAGYDLTRLAVGSRGALGIVTSATLKLLPLPQERRLLAFAFECGTEAAEAAAGILAAGGNPAALEIVDDLSLAAAANRGCGGILPRSGALLMVEVDGARSRCEAEASKAMNAVARMSGAERLDDGHPSDEGLWAARRSVLAALAGESVGVRLWHLRAAPSALPDLLSQVGEVSRRYGVRLAAFGHAGQGVLHLALGGDWTDGEWAARADFAVYRLTSLAEPLGVSVSPGGGIGPGVWPASDPSLGRTEAEVVGRLKAVFDPGGLMSGGAPSGGDAV